MKVLVNTDHVMRPTQFKGGFFFTIDEYSTRQIQITPLNFYHILIYQFPGKRPVENSKFAFFFFFLFTFDKVYKYWAILDRTSTNYFIMQPISIDQLHYSDSKVDLFMLR